MKIKDFYEKKDTVLICHDQGGLGDILMHRMIIKDIKNLNKKLKIVLACREEYMEAVEDHEDIDVVLDIKKVKKEEYLNVLETCTSIVHRYESKNAPCQEHRSDIWAKYCGIKIKNHDMQIKLNEKKTYELNKKIKKEFENGPLVFFCPISKMLNKCLSNQQMENIVSLIREKQPNSNIFAIHNKKIEILEKIGVKTICDLSIKEWIHFISLCDYIISVDTAAFHLAGNFKKPMVGIFTFADGKVYGKYFDFVLVQKHRDNKNWDCGPCFNFQNCPKSNKQAKPCLTELNYHDFKEGIFNLFEKWKWNY